MLIFISAPLEPEEKTREEEFEEYLDDLLLQSTRINNTKELLFNLFITFI